MSELEVRLQTKRLKHANNSSEYNLYRAALEYDLIHPIIIESKDDLKSQHFWKGKVNPYNHQVKNLITFCRRLPVSLLADDVGLGKTISAGLIMSELLVRGRIAKVLVVCPKILMPQWKEELDKKFGINSTIATGQDLLKAKLPDDIGAVITTYNSARIYLERLTEDNFDMLILDEAHKLRNLYGTDTPPQVAQRFQKALTDRMFKYVLMLTATPIQNRLWDLYSLVDLLTISRGHANPFGNTGLFARKYIADKKDEARKLKEESREEFRNVIYSYMSRIRRGDADLYFPHREVRLHNVTPSAAELNLIRVATKSIEGMNRLTQIGILQSLISSPEALIRRLENMVQNKTASAQLLTSVKEAASQITVTAKLKGLMTLIESLRNERPSDWRIVIFTRWLETQTTILCFLEKNNISYGVINGQSGVKNQATIKKFTADKPEINVIVSTEAGAEGVNLQAANVLVNYDLPWNPMIVEQRIGRIQRLGSKHENVCIFNITLKGTFEDYIVGRLMEKLQMAAHAIGDIEALLQATGTSDDEDADGFEDNILQLVLASLAGKNIEEDTRRQLQSIEDAKKQLEQSEKQIDEMLGSHNPDDTGPQCPSLPEPIYSMNPKNFVIAAVKDAGGRILQGYQDMCLIKLNGKEELARFDNENVESITSSTLYNPGTKPFDKLVSNITSKNLHNVEDVDFDLNEKCEAISQNWLKSFDGTFISFDIVDNCRSFLGSALVRTRATVTHDSYERLVEINCDTKNSTTDEGLDGGQSLLYAINDPQSIGLNKNELVQKAKLDQGIVEFASFYKERLDFELPSIGNDERKKKKLIDDFTTRYEFALVGLAGKTYRQLNVKVKYNLGGKNQYENVITVIPFKNEVVTSNLIACEITDSRVPENCLSVCCVSKKRVLKDLLVKSEISDRHALEQFIVECDLTHKKVISDEIGISALTGKSILKNQLKKSVISARLAEPEYFGICEFTDSDAFKEELAVSEVSAKTYRKDQELQSVISGKRGHANEFIFCNETRKPILRSEAERCEITGNLVMPGILQTCAVSKRRAVPSEFETSKLSGAVALKQYLVSSSLSGVRMLSAEAVPSAIGLYCSPQEAKICAWSSVKCHPEDIRICSLSGLSFHFQYVITEPIVALKSLVTLLNGTNRKAEKTDVWSTVVHTLGYKNSKVEASELSPDEKNLALSIETKTMLGLKSRQSGLVYSINGNVIVGRIVKGKREKNQWMEG